MRPAAYPFVYAYACYREVLMMVRKGVPGIRTLAVGDGANDVAMITAAHIGVRASLAPLCCTARWLAF